MHGTDHAKQTTQKESKETSVVQADSRSRFTISQAQSLLSQAFSRVWPVNT